VATQSSLQKLRSRDFAVLALRSVLELLLVQHGKIRVREIKYGLVEKRNSVYPRCCHAAAAAPSAPLVS
jgi:hypothetical protein